MHIRNINDTFIGIFVSIPIGYIVCYNPGHDYYLLLLLVLLLWLWLLLLLLLLLLLEFTERFFSMNPKRSIQGAK